MEPCAFYQGRLGFKCDSKEEAAKMPPQIEHEGDIYYFERYSDYHGETFYRLMNP